MRFRPLLFALALILPACGQAPLQESAGAMSLKKIGSFSEPLQVADPGGGALWVVEKGGRIILFKDGKRQGTVLDLKDQVSDGGEQGLLGVAPSPDFAQTGKAYVYITNTQGDGQLLEFTGNAAVLSKTSRRVLLTVAQPEDNHNGGALRFGPDGMLYLGLGDGGGAGDEHGSYGNAQNPESLLGKILRIDPNGSPYKIPDDNPLVGKPGRDEIWALGLRNPWRFSFDSKGRLWVGDVGQDSYEEIDLVKQGGENLGWRVYEGNKLFSPADPRPAEVLKPFHTYGRSDGRCSVVGGVVSEGRYLFGDTCDGRLRSLSLKTRKAKKTGLRVPSLVSIDQDSKRRVYLSSLTGPVFLLQQP